ncbi:DUF6053 domain-containing protein [Lysobacter enzymogenes]|uniref:DUF6053 domain-containing protein n=1 Tax=Lysobacter enzymogenes TaxID=69 RepID=UPI003CCE29B0
MGGASAPMPSGPISATGPEGIGAEAPPTKKDPSRSRGLRCCDGAGSVQRWIREPGSATRPRGRTRWRRPAR